MTEVDTTALRAAATVYGTYSTDFQNRVLPGLTAAGLPAMAFPALAHQLQSAYQEAWVAADLFCRTAADSFKTLNLALTRVANCYEAQDQKNANQFGPVTAPPVPTARAYDDSFDLGDWTSAAARGAIMSAGVGTALWMLFTHSSYLATSVAEVGAAFTVLAISGSAIGTLSDPLPWGPAHGGWDTIEQVLSLAATQVPAQGAKIVDDAGWKGAGPEAFKGYVEDKISGALDSANGLAAGMKEIAGSCGRNLWLGIGIYLATTIAAAAACMVLSFDPEPATRAAAKWALTLSWVGMIVNLALQMFGVWDVFGVAIDMIKTGYRGLHASMMNDDRQLDADSIALKTSDTERIQDWTGWEPKTA